MFFQFYVAEARLSCSLYVRSNDLFLGAPFNIGQYALLTHMIAQQCDLDGGDLVYTIGDAHLYLNHLDQVAEQLTRDPYPLPQLHIRRKPDSIFDYRYEDFELVDYRYHPTIKAPIAV
jgi:thymidylate synthase